MQLPLKIDDVTPRWLSQALSIRTPGTQVAEIENMDVILGTTAKLLLTLKYKNKPNAGSPPRHLCLKAGFDDSLRELVGDAYIAEANFFDQIAPMLDAPMLRCWFANAQPERQQGVVIFDNLIQQGASFGNPMEPMSVDLAAKALEVQARWHAQTWGATKKQFPCLHQGSWIRVPATQLFGEDNWRRAYSVASIAKMVPEKFQSRERIVSAYKKMWQIDDAEGIPCLSHSDPHLGNTYVDATGQPGFMDWQSGSLAPAMDDVSYFLVGALTVDDRRANERNLFKHYLDVLQSSLGAALNENAMWMDYIRHCMHGFVWTVVPHDMQPLNCAEAMTARYITALEDHETLKYLR